MMHCACRPGEQTPGGAGQHPRSLGPLKLFLVFACMPLAFTYIPKAGAMDSLLQDLSPLLERALRLEQAGIPAFRRIQQHMAVFMARMEEAQDRLWEAVATDDAEGVKVAVERGAVVERRNAEGMSVPAEAAKEGRAEAVRALLSLGAEVDGPAGKEVWSPLRWAVEYRKKECEVLLRAAGAKMGDERDVLLESVGQKSPGADANLSAGARRPLQRGPVFCLVQDGHNVLRDADDRADAQGTEDVGQAAVIGRVSPLPGLLGPQADLNISGEGGRPDFLCVVEDAQKSLWEAVARDDVEDAETAVRFGADLEAKDGEQMTALGLAARDGRVRVLATLLRLGARANATAGRWGWSPLLWALVHKQNQAERLLRGAGAQQEVEMSKAEAQDMLWKGVEQDDGLLIQGAVLSGADLEDSGSLWSPLVEAAGKSKLGALRTLLRLGAGLERRSGWRKWTALNWAAGEGREAAVKELLASGAQLEAADSEGRTPLHSAAARGRLGTVKLLVEAGAALGARDNSGATPLDLAVKEHPAVALYLRHSESTSGQ